ncbi:MAG: glycosyltransferase [Candidatus Melainabacteria bacterium]|nr:glycosyltransferase [Candidatus Melainabacteria bacterium]
MNHKSQSLSVVMVTQNHSRLLDRALESVRWADEIIVIDGGSTDGSLAIARRHTQQVYYLNHPNLAVLRRYGVSVAKGDWILFIEPHEWVEDMLCHCIEGILVNSKGNTQLYDGFLIPIQMYYQQRWLQWGAERRAAELRLVRRSKVKLPDHSPFANPWVPGPMLALEQALQSEPFRSVEELFRQVSQRAQWAAYALLENKRPSSLKASVPNLLIQPTWAFLKYYVGHLGLLDGAEGLTMAMARSYYHFLIYSRYRQLLTNSKQLGLIRAS